MKHPRARHGTGMLVAAVPVALAVWSCSAVGASPSGPAVGGDDASASEEASAFEASAPGDAGTTTPDAAPTADSGTYRNSLRVCWNDATCPRALAISHGGDWNFSGPPYDSNAALAAAYTNGADGVKIDVRITSDDVPVISHSSPILAYESVDCQGKKIEEMTATQVTSCHRFPSNEAFQRLDDVLESLRGKLVAQLCVKRNTDFGRTIAEVLARGAADFAFIEVNAGDFASIPPLPGSNQVYYLINAASSLTDVDTILALHNPRVIMMELDPTVQLSGLAATKLHPAGVRAFTYDNSSTATAQSLKALFDEGYDVVSSNLTAPDVQARIQVNTPRGVSPP